MRRPPDPARLGGCSRRRVLTGPERRAASGRARDRSARACPLPDRPAFASAGRDDPPLPLGGVGGVDAAMTYALTAVGAPLALALVAVGVYRLLPSSADDLRRSVAFSLLPRAGNRLRPAEPVPATGMRIASLPGSLVLASDSDGSDESGAGDDVDELDEAARRYCRGAVHDRGEEPRREAAGVRCRCRSSSGRPSSAAGRTPR